MDSVQIAETALPGRLVMSSVVVLGTDGAPVRNTDVVVEQIAHAFRFGNIGFDQIDLANGAPSPGDEEIAERWLELFNTATLPFYWGRFEAVRGKPDTERLRAAARWFVQRGVQVKGHPLAWHSLAPTWLLDLSLDEIEDALRARIRREVTDFAGLIDTWDVINEVVIMPVFDKDENGLTRLASDRGRIATIQLAFEETRSANPNATLLLNDFDLSPAYERLIEGVLDAGIQIDAIGLQTHMHQGYRGEESMGEILDRFARFGRPLHLTETSLVSGDLMPGHIVDLNDFQPSSWPSTQAGEARQADEIERHYRSLLSQPAVEAITYWGITDRGAWLGAPIGLLRTDGSPKPSFEKLRDLIKGAWWLPATTVRTDSDGLVRIGGFAGDYRVSVGGRSTQLSLTESGRTTASL